MSLKAISISLVAAAALMGSSAFAQTEVVVGAGAGGAAGAAVGGVSVAAATFVAVSATVFLASSKATSSTTGTK